MQPLARFLAAGRGLRTLSKGKVALIGYVPAVEVMLQGTPDMVYNSAVECLQNGVDVLTAGCSMPPHTTSANIAALVRATENWPQPALDTA